MPNPLPSIPLTAYTHIAAFTKHAPIAQQHALWNEVALQLRKTLKEKGNEVPIWLSTSGLGVYWLHIRLDTTPKYYNWKEYKLYHTKN